jgi:hypothetical protein
MEGEVGLCESDAEDDVSVASVRLGVLPSGGVYSRFALSFFLFQYSKFI